LEKPIPSIPSIPFNESKVPSNETSKTITGPLEKPIPSIPSIPFNESKVPSNETSKTITGPLEKPIPSIPSIPFNESKVPSNETSKTITGPLEKPIPSIPSIPSNESKVPSNETSKTIDNGTTMGFQTYQNNIFGIKIRYPDSWSVRSYPYNNANNNTVVGFYSPSKTASQLGNISGVSGHFIPYLDIFAFDSKNMSLDKIINGRINRIQNTSDFVLDSKPFTLKGNYSAYMLVYSAITGGDEFFKKMQIYTIFGNKVYLITFTAQEALFSNYLPTVRKMVDSFEIDF
jgi:PsbP-like protein